jgi:hypothetical protein
MAAGNSITNHRNFTLKRNSQDLLVERPYGALTKSRKENNRHHQHLIITAEGIRLVRPI